MFITSGVMLTRLLQLITGITLISSVELNTRETYNGTKGDIYVITVRNNRLVCRYRTLLKCKKKKCHACAFGTGQRRSLYYVVRMRGELVGTEPVESVI